MEARLRPLSSYQNPSFSEHEERDFSRTMFPHDVEKFDDDLGAWSDHDLSLAGLLGVVHCVKGIVKHGCFDHDGGGL